MNIPRTSKLWDIRPQPELLNPEDDQHEMIPTFEACLNAHGMYETMRFVLRLSPRNHELMDSIKLGMQSVEDIDPEALQAYSTYIHETVHWWQHVGSTSGLLLSLSYLGQTHSTMAQLREVIATFGLKKPLKRWTDEVLLREGFSAQSKLSAANIAVNNALDVEYYKSYADSPKQNAAWLRKQQHFESIGHGYSIAYGQLLGMLADTVDPNRLVLPNTKNWDSQFARLTKEQHEGFYWGSPMHVPSLGLRAIYEGQARFVQLQFLNATRASPPSCQKWREMGFLSGIYVEAFEQFLALSKSNWPKDIDDPIVGLFLLVCDLAINPTRGFPFDIESFEDFILDVDVGVRFMRLSTVVADKPHLRTAIRSLSRDEYVEVSEQLTASAGYDHPLSALQEIADWVDRSPGLERLMSEQRTFEFELTNLPIRVFFSQFVSFVRDKLERPEFFCWPGLFLVGQDANEQTMTLWLRHLSLFSDRGDKPGVYPRKWPDRDEGAVKRMFERFYGTMALYDLTRQWILKDGPFVFDFEWLLENYSQEHVEAWGNDTFKQIYGVNLKDFEILA
jgi:hypothetical protein